MRLVASAIVTLLRLFALDKRSLALYRIAMGLVTIYDLALRFPDIHNHYADRGIISRALALEKFNNNYWISVHMLAGTDFYIQVVFLLHAIVAGCMMVGYRTRLMTFLNWLLVCSLQNRNYIVCHSGDTVQRVMLFWSMFLPLGEVFSLDSVIWKKKRKEHKGIDYEVVGTATMAFTIQIYIMYVTAHFHKSGSEWRVDGTATWMALQLDFFRTWVGDILIIFPWLCKQLTFFVLYWQVTGVCIYFLPVGKYNQYLKALSVFGFLCMHLGFGMCLALEQFTWVTEASLMGVIPGWVWDEGVKHLSKDPKRSVHIYYLQRCRFCTLLAEVLGLFMLPRTKVTPTDVLPGGAASYGFLGIAVVDYNRVHHSGPNALEAIMKASPILSPLQYIFRTKPVKNFIGALSAQAHFHRVIPSDVESQEEYGSFSPSYNKSTKAAANILSAGVGEKGFDAPAEDETNDASLSGSGKKDEEAAMHDLDVYSQNKPLRKKKVFKNESVNMYALRKTIPVVSAIVSQIIAGFLLVLILTWNSGNIGMPQYGTPTSLRPIMWVTQLDQYWGMFAPRPPDTMWWYNIQGVLDDGRSAELFNDGVLFTFEPNMPHTFDKPKSLHASMGNHRWFKLFENGLNSHEAREELRLNFGRWFCREFNSRHTGSDRLHKYDIHWMNERVDMVKQDGTRHPGNKQTIWSHICYNK